MKGTTYLSTGAGLLPSTVGWRINKFLLWQMHCSHCPLGGEFFVAFSIDASTLEHSQFLANFSQYSCWYSIWTEAGGFVPRALRALFGAVHPTNCQVAPTKWLVSQLPFIYKICHSSPLLHPWKLTRNPKNGSLEDDFHFQVPCWFSWVYQQKVLTWKQNIWRKTRWERSCWGPFLEQIGGWQCEWSGGSPHLADDGSLAKKMSSAFPPGMSFGRGDQHHIPFLYPKQPPWFLIDVLWKTQDFM